MSIALGLLGIIASVGSGIFTEGEKQLSTLHTDNTQSSSLYSKIWSARDEKFAKGSTDQKETYSSIDQDMTPYGETVTKFPNKINTTDDIGRIITPDRRQQRIKRPIDHIEDNFPNDVPINNKFTIIMGIPSIDTEYGSTCRHIQRKTFFKYSSVWNNHKKLTSQMVIKYALSYHSALKGKVSRNLLREATVYKDIVFFNLKDTEGQPLSTLITHSRKVYAWFSYTVDTYNTDYIAIGLDDAFYRCNMMVQYYNSIKIPRVYHGRGGESIGYFKTEKELTTISFDIADWIRDSKNVENKNSYPHDDLIGMWFAMSGIPFTAINDCRIQVRRSRRVRQPVKNNSIVIRLGRPDVFIFAELLEAFPDSNMTTLPEIHQEFQQGGVHWESQQYCIGEHQV